MNSTKIDGATREVGRSQGYIPLYLRDEVINDGVTGPGTPAMVTEWVPTAEERQWLLEGGNIKLVICGSVHPPVMLTVDKARG